MEFGSDFVSPDKRVTENDFRSGQYWSERPDESNGGDGWTWVAAILVAALFIISGYLDQESAMSQPSSAEAPAKTYAANGVPQAMSFARSDKGY